MSHARLRPHWYWRQLKCALGIHKWCMGPYTAEQQWRNERGNLEPIPQAFTPYFCGFSSPWCKATKRVIR